MATRVFDAGLPLERVRPDKAQGSLTVDERGVLSQPLVLGPGLTVTGRVVRDGQPVASIAMALKSVDSSFDFLAGNPDTKTDLQGVFRFEHVLPDKQFAAHAVWGSLERGGTIIPCLFHTGDDGTTVDLGQLQVEQGKALAGRVVFSDGKTPYRKAVLIASPKNSPGVEVNLDETGRFRIEGLPRGPVSVSCFFHGEKGLEEFPTGYRLSPRNKCLSPGSCFIEGQLDRDITDLTILFEPGEAPRLGDVRSYMHLDPTALADFKDAAAGPITGVPPQSVNGK